jgi:hypothetical protein
LPRDDIDPDTQRDLRRWVQAGGVLWVETDLALAPGFGATGLRKDSPPSRSGQGQVASVNHPLVQEYTRSSLGPVTVPYTLDPNGLLLSGAESDFLSRLVLPLVVETPGRQRQMCLVCGIWPLDNGYVALRPMVLTGPTGTRVTSLETELLQFSLAPSREGWPQPPSAPNPNMNRRGTRSRTRQPLYPRRRGAE